jgi:hypothetical protein
VIVDHLVEQKLLTRATDPDADDDADLIETDDE